MHKLASRAVRAAVAASVLLGGAALSCAAAAGGTTAARHQVRHVVFGPATRYALSNWGGYIAEGSSGEFVKASAQWTIAKVTCTSSNDLYAPWVGIDGAGDSTVEQTGVQTDCSSGSPVASAWYEMYPAPPVYFANAVSIGDHFTASVTYSSSSFTLVISDKTQGWTHTVRKSLSAQRLSAEAVIEAPGGGNTYPKFTSVNFTSVKFNGQDLATFSPVASDTGTTSHELVPTAITNGDDFKMVPKA